MEHTDRPGSLTMATFLLSVMLGVWSGALSPGARRAAAAPPPAVPAVAEP